MTPQELELITNDYAEIATDPDGFGKRFYEALFHLVPQVRSIYSSDMTNLASKLVRELSRLLTTAATPSEPSRVGAFCRRLKGLGRREGRDGPGAISHVHEPVGVALVAALREQAPGFDVAHEQAWLALVGSLGAGTASTAHLSSMIRVVDFVRNGTVHPNHEHARDQRNVAPSHQMTSRTPRTPSLAASRC